MHILHVVSVAIPPSLIALAFTFWLRVSPLIGMGAPISIYIYEELSASESVNDFANGDRWTSW